MRYQLNDEAEYGWRVNDTLNDVLVAYSLPMAEAHIIAWALNAVVNGWLLMKVTPPHYEGDSYHDETEYDGPTDGVAP